MVELGKQIPEIVIAIFKALTSNESINKLLEAGKTLLTKIVDGALQTVQA